MRNGVEEAVVLRWKEEVITPTWRNEDLLKLVMPENKALQINRKPSPVNKRLERACLYMSKKRVSIFCGSHRL